MGANFDASDSKLLPAPPELTASLSPWLSEMKNFLAPLQEHPAVATSLSLYGTYRARLAYLTPLLQRIQLMAANIHTKKNDLLLRLSQASEHAYTITDERINTQLIQVLKTEAEKLNQEVVEMQKGLPTPPIIFSGIAKQWKKEISLLSKVSPQLTSYFCMTDMILLCQCKRHGEAENAVLEALSEYLKANNPDSRDEVLSFCRNLFKVVKIFEKILEWQEKTDGADISEINQMIDSLEDSILGATEFDLVSHLYNPTQLQWYRDICIYLGYAFHDSLNSTSDKLKDMINKVPPSSWSQRFMQIIVRFHKLVNTDLRKIPVLFTIIAAEARGDNDNDKLSNKYMAFNNLAHFYGTMGFLEEAEKCANFSIKLNPIFPLNHYNLGLIYYAKNQPEQAVASFKNADNLCRGFAVDKENKKIANELSKKIFQWLANIETKKYSIFSFPREVVINHADFDKLQALQAKVGLQCRQLNLEISRSSLEKQLLMRDSECDDEWLFNRLSCTAVSPNTKTPVNGEKGTQEASNENNDPKDVAPCRK
jgi:tetratricopeptide (TPR) repeat protein